MVLEEEHGNTRKLGDRTAQIRALLHGHIIEHLGVGTCSIAIVCYIYKRKAVQISLEIPPAYDLELVDS
jgi:hypothetical protein